MTDYTNNEPDRDGKQARDFVEKHPEMQMLSQPLLTDEGLLNEACLNEMSAAINNMPAQSVRLASEPEYQIRAIMTEDDLIGAIAGVTVPMYSRRGYIGLPPGLHEVIGYAAARFRRECEIIEGMNYRYITLIELAEFMEDVARECEQVKAWNDCGNHPEGDFIDLGAWSRNVVIRIREMRRHSWAFDWKFEKEYSEQERGPR